MTDADTLRKIYLSVRTKLSRAVVGIVPPTEVEDIVQETYVRVCQVESRTDIRTPRSFIFKTARNLALDHVKSAAYRLSVSSEEISDTESLGADRNHDETYDEAASNEEFARFCEAVRLLPVQCRRAFVLKKVYGFSQREIAKEMGLSENTVEKHIAKGIRRCSDFMEQRDSREASEIKSRESTSVRARSLVEKERS